MNNWSNIIRIAGVISCIISETIFLSGCATPQNWRSENSIKAEQLIQRGVRSADKGLYNDSEQLLKEAIRISASIEDRPSEFLAGVYLARLYRLNNRLQDSEKTIKSILDLPESETGNQSEALYEYALLKLLQGDRTKALFYARKSLQINEEQKGRYSNLIGRILLQQGDIKGAKIEAEKSLAANSASGLEEEIANSLLILGVIARIENEFENSENMLLKALSKDKKLGIPQKIARDLFALAETAIARGDKDSGTIYKKRGYDVQKAAEAKTQAGSEKAVTTTPSNNP